MERFKANISSRYRPTVAVHATLECDAVVRTVSAHRSLTSLLCASQPNSSSSDQLPLIRIAEAASLKPLKWLNATQRLDSCLKQTQHTKPPSKLINNFTNTLEDVTAVANHEHFSVPILTILSAWVGEQNIVENLNNISPNLNQNPLTTSVDPLPTTTTTQSATISLNRNYHVLLVLRDTSRQDEAARQHALDSVIASFGRDNVHLLRLPDPDPPASHSPPALAAALHALAHEALAADLAQLSRTVKSLRASRSTLRSWFTGPQISTIPMRPPPQPDNSHDGITDRRRRLSVSGGANTPLFPPDSIEALSRRLADLYFLTAKYHSAIDEYAALIDEFRSLQGAALVHVASAREMLALGHAMTDLAKQAVGSGLERAVQEYVIADRKELAIRAALRAVNFCFEAGFPDSAAGVGIRAMGIIEPNRGTTVVTTPGDSGNFVDTIMAVLATTCCDAFAKLGNKRRRRASMYAYLAATKFVRLKHVSAAACVANMIDDKALERAGVREDVELMLGAAEAEDKMYGRAATLFAGVMTNCTTRTDLEAQGSAVRGLLTAIALGADKSMRKKWDSGVTFPVILQNETKVTTYDMGSFETDKAWHSLDDDVLEDYEFFRALGACESNENAPIPKRARKIETVIAELRKQKEQGADNDPGGSLEMKIKRMREIADGKKKARRKRSLVDHGVVVNEEIMLQAVLQNPLQFPVFVGDLCPVLMFDGRCYFSPTSFDSSEEKHDDPIEFCPTTNLTIGPCSSSVVQMRLLAKKPGTLKFLGMTWDFSFGITSQNQKLPDCKARGFCLFERKGRRLNKTRKQRASEVPLYEEDLSLSATIIPPAPKLRIWLTDSLSSNEELDINSSILRAGENRSVYMVIQNDGPEIAKTMAIRIGTPQTAFLTITPDIFQRGDQEYLYAIGVNEEHVEENEFVASLRVVINLNTGEQKRIPLHLRASVPRFAFGHRSGLGGVMKIPKTSDTYHDGNERSEDGSVLCNTRIAIAYGAKKTRLSRLSLQFKVRPSILVSPRFLREADSEILSTLGKNLSGVLIGVEVEHGGNIAEEDLAFDITSLAVTSKGRWKPMNLPSATTPANAPTTEISALASRLRVNETATYFVLIVRDEKANYQLAKISDSTSQVWNTVVSKQAIPGDYLNTAGNTPNGTEELNGLDFMNLNTVRHFSLHSSPHIEKSSPLRQSLINDQVFLAIGWKASTGVAGDIHILPINPLRWMTQRTSPTSSSSTSVTDAISDPTLVPKDESHFDNDTEAVIVKVVHPKSMTHNFFPDNDSNENMAGSHAGVVFPAIVSVDVQIRNVSRGLLDVIFGAPTTEGVADGARGRFWAGDVEMSLRSIPPGVERVINLTAILTKPGKYNMSHFSISCQTSGFTAVRSRKHIEVNPSYMILEASGNTILNENSAELLQRQLESMTLTPTKGRRFFKLPLQHVLGSKSRISNEQREGSRVRIAENQLSKSVSTNSIQSSISDKTDKASGRSTWFSSLRRSASGLVRSQSGQNNNTSVGSSPEKSVNGQNTKPAKKSCEDADWDTSDTEDSDS